jgi:hypothetical protein
VEAKKPKKEKNLHCRAYSSESRHESILCLRTTPSLSQKPRELETTEHDRLRYQTNGRWQEAAAM